MGECTVNIHGITHTGTLYITQHSYYFYNAHYNYTHYQLAFTYIYMNNYTKQLITRATKNRTYEPEITS